MYPSVVTNWLHCMSRKQLPPTNRFLVALAMPLKKSDFLERLSHEDVRIIQRTLYLALPELFGELCTEAMNTEWMEFTPFIQHHEEQIKGFRPQS